MLRDAITLADVRSPTIEIVCEPCGRHGRYNVERLIAKHGPDMRLPELKTILANCPKARSFSVYAAAKSATRATRRFAGPRIPRRRTQGDADER